MVLQRKKLIVYKRYKGPATAWTKVSRTSKARLAHHRFGYNHFCTNTEVNTSHTAPKRTTRERTGYVAIAGGKKGSVESSSDQSNMKDHMENAYAKVPPQEEFFEDESASLQNKLKMVKTKIGNGEQTKELLEYDNEPFPDKEKESSVYLEKFKDQLSTYNDDREKQLNLNRKMMKTNYRLVDPFTDHPYGVNYGRKGGKLKATITL